MSERSIVERAAEYALLCHAGMKRKNGLPYILHPMEVAVIASTMTENEEVVAAGLLHDVVEDTDHTLEEIQDLFGPRIMELVAAETEDKREELSPEESWQIRKEESIVELNASDDRDVKILWLSDKLSNMRSFDRMHEEEGDAMWQHFHCTDPNAQSWYYNAVADATEELKDTPAWQEYRARTDRVFGKRETL